MEAGAVPIRRLEKKMVEVAPIRILETKIGGNCANHKPGKLGITAWKMFVLFGVYTLTVMLILAIVYGTVVTFPHLVFNGI